MRFQCSRTASGSPHRRLERVGAVLDVVSAELEHEVRVTLLASQLEAREDILPVTGRQIVGHPGILLGVPFGQQGQQALGDDVRAAAAHGQHDIAAADTARQVVCGRLDAPRSRDLVMAQPSHRVCQRGCAGDRGVRVTPGPDVGDDDMVRGREDRWPARPASRRRDGR